MSGYRIAARLRALIPPPVPRLAVLLISTLVLLLPACSIQSTRPSGDDKPEPASPDPVAPPQDTDPRSDPASTRSQPEQKGIGTAAKSADYRFRRIGNLTDARAAEVSGLALSALSNNRLWMINDSGNGAHLLAFSHTGQFQASVPTTIRNRDWEAMSGFTLDAEAYLLVADTGDNLQAHARYTLAIFHEPELDPRRPAGSTEQPVAPVSEIAFVYPDGRHDCEAVAVSVPDRTIILITKSATRPGIYSLPLRLAHDDQVLSAKRLGSLPVLQQTWSDHLLGYLVGVDLSQATALDIDPQGSTAWLLSYRAVYRWQRPAVDMPWGEVLSGQPQQIARHSLAQAEALATSHLGNGVFIVSEKLPSPILELHAATLE